MFRSGWPVNVCVCLFQAYLQVKSLFDLGGFIQLLQFVTWIDSPNVFKGHVFSWVPTFTRSRLEEPNDRTGRHSTTKLLHPWKLTAGTQSHEGLVQMISLFKAGWFSGSKAVNFPGCLSNWLSLRLCCFLSDPQHAESWTRRFFGNQPLQDGRRWLGPPPLIRSYEPFKPPFGRGTPLRLANHGY